MAHDITPFQSLTCPVARTASIVCGKWTLLIIRDLANGPRRFCHLERSLAGISPKTLSDRLHVLEREGIVNRQTFGEVPPRVEYSLTEKGCGLADVIEVMRSFGSQWLVEETPYVEVADSESAPSRAMASIN